MHLFLLVVQSHAVEEHDMLTARLLNFSDIDAEVAYTRLKMTTHPSTNRARRWATSLICRTTLTTMPRRQHRCA